MTTPPPVGCEDAKENIDWVLFKDAPARATFDRAVASGKSAYDAVITAQAHRADVQGSIRSCHVWAKTYLEELGFGEYPE